MSESTTIPKPLGTKTARPPCAHAQVRPETLAKYRRACRHRLTVVCAPAGYGKTTTTAAALASAGHDDLWYKLDVLDHDPAVLLTSLTEALGQRFAGFGKELLERARATPEDPFPLADMTSMFVAECYEHVRSPLHLVLDDVQEAADSRALAEVLDRLIADLPPAVRFVLLSRYEPPISMAKLKVDDDVGFIEVDSLRFTPEQAVEVLERRTGRRVARDHVARLVALAEGWPASVVLASLALEWLDLDSLEAALADPRLKLDMYSYLAEQVLKREPESIRHFLLDTCCLQTVTVELADQLTLTGTSEHHLDHLAVNRVFTFSTGVPGAYRYHPLFRDFLRHKFVQDRGRESFHGLQTRTAAVLEQSGEVELAVELLLNANEPLDALTVIARAGEPGLDNFETERLSSWLSRLQTAVDSGEPWARLLEGQLLSRAGEYARAVAVIDDALESFDAAQDEWGLYQGLSMRECALFWKGDMPEALDACEAALSHAQTHQQKMHTLLSLASAAIDMRRWPEADAAFAAADAIAHRASRAERARAQALRGHALYYRGEFLKARASASTVDQSALSPSGESAALNTQGLVMTALAEYEEALRLYGKAEDVARRHGHSLAADIVADNVGFAKSAQGHSSEGLRLVRQVTRIRAVADEPTMLACTLSHEATILRRSGQLRAALPPCQMASELVLAERDPYLALGCRANLAYLQSLLGSPHVAALMAIAESAEEAGVQSVSLEAKLFAAIVAHANGDIADACAFLDDCLPAQAEKGHYHVLAQELGPRPHAALLAFSRMSEMGVGASLSDALARHWRFGDVVAATLEHRPEYAPLAVQSAMKFSTDETLRHVVSLCANEGSPALAQAVDAARQHRPSAFDTTDEVLGELTSRELQILEMMAAGRRNPEIAAELFVSAATVKTHVNHIFCKLGVTDRVKAVLLFGQRRHA